MTRFRRLTAALAFAFHALLALAPALYLSAVSLGWVFRSAIAMTLVARRVGAIAPPLAGESLEALVREVTAPPGLVPLAIPGLLWVVAAAFGRIARAARGLRFAHDLRAGWAVHLRGLAIFAGSWILLGASVVLLTLRPYLTAFAGAFGVLGPPEWLVGGALIAVLIAVTWGSFVALLRFLPRPPIGWGAACGRANLSLVGWEALRRLFARVLLGSPSSDLVAGALAGTVALLLWIYGSAAVMLLGAEFGAILAGRRGESNSGVGFA